MRRKKGSPEIAGWKKPKYGEAGSFELPSTSGSFFVPISRILSLALAPRLSPSLPY